MKKKYFLLIGLIPLFYSCANKTNVNKINYQSTPVAAISEEDEEADACTVMYVGKELSTNGKAIIARSSDAGPGAMSIYTKMFPQNALANQTVTSNKGFTYKMPSSTYRYISTPRNSVIHKGHHWEASAINEKGVGVSATLSCYSKPEAIDPDNEDPLVPTGLGEDNIAQIVGATAATAKEGIETIANIIKEQGACEPNAIMVIDQNEAWYMEIYTGHQYAAVKCPDNKILTAGNEFVLDSLFKMGINIEDTVLSDDLLRFPIAKGFVQYDGEGTGIKHLHLFKTYARELVYEDPNYENWPGEDSEEGKKRITNDNAHRRTWRGYNMFSKNKYNTAEYTRYIANKKYDAFYDIDDGTKLDIHDITSFMRDRFESIFEFDGEPNAAGFGYDKANGNLRYIGIENAYQIHIIQSDGSLPPDMAATEWLSISNSNYTPFVPLTCGTDRFSSYYTKVSPTFEYDEGSAANIFKRLNTLARSDRENYGKQIEEFWNTYELIWDEQYYKLVDQVKDMDLNSRYEIMDNFTIHIQDTAIKTALFMIDDLAWHAMNDSFEFGTPTKFRPCINVKDYALAHGYSYEKISNTVKFAKGEEKYSLSLVNQEYRPGPETKDDYRTLGEITYGGTKENIDMVVDGENVYVPLNDLERYIKGEVVINANDYRDPFDHAIWIVPTVIVVPIAFGIGFHFINKKRKER